MGTRGLVGFIVNEKIKASYNHSSSYPEHLGKIVLEFIKEQGSFVGLRDKVEVLKLVTENKKPTKKDIEYYNEFLNLGVGDGKADSWYCLLRELQGGNLLKQVDSGKVKHIIDDSDYINDSLFCEYVYLINLDTFKLEYYIGFQHIPDFNSKLGSKSNEGYYPCRLVKEYDLNKINNRNVNKIIKEMETLSDKWYKANNYISEEKQKVYNITIEDFTKKYIEKYGSLDKMKLRRNKKNNKLTLLN